VIQGNLEAVLDGVYPPDAEHIQPALDQAQLLARLVEDLRTLALAEAGQLSLDLQPTHAAELVKRVTTSFEPKAAEKRVTLSASTPPALPPVRADGQRIAQTRAARATRAAGGGSGLGLAIARSIVEAHGGRIWAESKIGEGTTITFTLPVAT
jgi:two-component system OmpR family sensor kinase/two-component system sensor histidine kinase BaeS